MKRAALLLLVTACSLPPAERGKAWAVSSILASPGKTFGGFETSRLAAKAGTTVPYTGPDYGTAAVTAATDVVVVQPAYFEHAPAAYVVTEIWENHPDPWVQAVYHFVKPYDAVAPGSHRTGADGVFTVDTDSTFYSPFWRLWWAEPGDAVGPYTNVAQIAKFPMHKGPLVVCPIVPPNVVLSGTEHPFVSTLSIPKIAQAFAYVNGTRVSYLPLSADKQETFVYSGEADMVAPEELYVFARTAADGTRKLLDLPAVLPTSAPSHAFMRRIDVVLDTQDVFVPASLPALRTKLKAEGFAVHDADPLISDADARSHLLRVAVDGNCFETVAAFATCQWLDSEEAIEESVGSSRIFETDVTLTATPVLLP